MLLNWPNGCLSLGWLCYRDAYGVELAWGRRDLMGEDVREGETWFSDRVTIEIATGRQVAVHGSVWKAALMTRLFPERSGQWDTGPNT